MEKQHGLRRAFELFDVDFAISKITQSSFTP
jgi:hypothetical protein